MIKSPLAFLQLQLKAMSIHYFIVKFDEFERKVKEIFSHNISCLADEKKQLLYFYLAGVKCSTYIDYTAKAIQTVKLRFTKDEKFTSFTLNQIVKIQRQELMFGIFEFNIPSINNKSTEYTFTDCCLKLISMRNKLAHEMADLSFGEKDIIELLSNEYIHKNSSSWFQTMDADKMDDDTKHIFSNLVMIERIMRLLEEREDTYENQAMDTQ